jgi:hypothetical protein
VVSLTLDLDEYRVIRLSQSSEEDRDGIKIIELPRSRVRLSLRLREGNLAGLYSVSIVDAFNKALSTSKARSADGKILRVTLDTSRLEEKAYRLCISLAGEAPEYYPIVVKTMKRSPAPE